MNDSIYTVIRLANIGYWQRKRCALALPCQMQYICNGSISMYMYEIFLHV